MSIAPSEPGQPEPTQHRPRLYSGMQPTSDSLHLGNYLGALTNWVALQESYDSIFCVVDLHSLTVQPDPHELRMRTRRTAAQYIAGGIDPDKSILYVQSHVPEHAQLAWVLSCITGFGEASRMTQFKDKSAKRGAEGTTVGLFTYPVLMAADILLYDTERVPTGEDQRQHVELSRDLAQRINARYGQTVVVPEAHIVKSTAKIQDLQDPLLKMSKSSPNPQGILDLLDEPKVMTKRIKSAVTDTDPEMAVYFSREDKPGISNLLTIYSALSGRTVEEIAQEYTGRGYGYLKNDLAELVVATLTPFRERTFALLDDSEALDSILADGAERARAIAHETLTRIHDHLGLVPASSRKA